MDSMGHSDTSLKAKYSIQPPARGPAATGCHVHWSGTGDDPKQLLGACAAGMEKDPGANWMV